MKAFKQHLEKNLQNDKFKSLYLKEKMAKEIQEAIKRIVLEEKLVKRNNNVTK